MLLPGVGFDVVPSDCLAAHLKRRLPAAARLALGFQASTGVSRGTAVTLVENAGRGGLVRRGGALVRVPSAWKTRLIDFGAGPRKAITIPWGDVATAWYSTGIPEIEVYFAAPPAVRIVTRLSRYFGWALARPSVQAVLKRRIRAGPPGPTPEERARGKSYLWGEALDSEGNNAVSRLRGPEGYTLTVLASLAVVEQVLAGRSPPGYQTPSTAYGPDFVLRIEGVVREDQGEVFSGSAGNRPPGA
jgi:short subunit dehydrogenase-like uncharacterized protein